MPQEIIIAIMALGGVALTAMGGLAGAWLSRRSSMEATQATVKAQEDSAQDRLIDQLQEELSRYRSDNDRRVERLEAQLERLRVENRGYREFIGVQRDHMAAHKIPLPPWPEDLPR